MRHRDRERHGDSATTERTREQMRPKRRRHGQASERTNATQRQRERRIDSATTEQIRERMRPRSRRHGQRAKRRMRNEDKERHGDSVTKERRRQRRRPKRRRHRQRAKRRMRHSHRERRRFGNDRANKTESTTEARRHGQISRTTNATERVKAIRRRQSERKKRMQLKVEDTGGQRADQTATTE